jgi:hypothetical protein
MHATQTAEPPHTAAHARRIRLIDDLAEIETIRATWEAAPVSRADAHIDFYLAFAASREEFVRPYVLLVERGDELEAMLVARVEDVELPAKVGYRQIFSARVRAITLVHGGVVGANEEIAPLLVRELSQSLARGEADLVRLPALPVDSPLHRTALTMLPAYRRQPPSPPGVHRILELPATMQEFLGSRSKSTRESVKRYRKKLERDLGARLELRAYEDPSDIDRIFADTEPVAVKTYQHGLGVALADTAEQRALVEVGLEHGWFRAYVLYLDERAIAFWPGYAFRGTFFIGTPGYDPEYTEYRVGTYLQMRLTEHLCEDPALDAVDYGFGDAEYKRRFGTRSWEESDVLAFAAAPRALAIHGARSTVVIAANAARAVLGRVGLLARVKQGWRRRLATRQISS